MKRIAATIIDTKNAVFAYFSTCCNEPAVKPSLVKPKGNHVGDYVGFKPDATDGSLGSWRCGKCRKPCSVTRAKKSSSIEGRCSKFWLRLYRHQAGSGVVCQ
jgi:hypothetical protein